MPEYPPPKYASLVKALVIGHVRGESGERQLLELEILVTTPYTEGAIDILSDKIGQTITVKSNPAEFPSLSYLIGKTIEAVVWGEPAEPPFEEYWIGTNFTVIPAIGIIDWLKANWKWLVGGGIGIALIIVLARRK